MNIERESLEVSPQALDQSKRDHWKKPITDHPMWWFINHHMFEACDDLYK